VDQPLAEELRLAEGLAAGATDTTNEAMRWASNSVERSLGVMPGQCG
jgi:hypothetical protein